MSTPTLKLISHALCPYVQRARIVLNETQRPHSIEMIDLSNKPAAFLQWSPLGKVPLLLVDSTPVFESAVIAEYLDELDGGSLLPSEPLAKAQSRAWIAYASDLLGLIWGWYTAADKLSLHQQTELLTQRMQLLESELKTGPWFLGEKFSLVDAAFAPVFRYFDVVEAHTELPFFQGTPKVSQWRSDLARRPSVIDAVDRNYATLLMQFIHEQDSALARQLFEPQAA